MRWMLAVAVLGLAALNLDAGRAPQNDPVTIRVDTTVKKGPMHPFWAWFGHDEPNYTYTPNGTKLLSALQELSPVPVFMRVHNLLTSGDGTHALKWGSTNVYTEDASGNPSTTGRSSIEIVDTYMARRMKPFVQLGFMPEALSSAPPGLPYRHFWKPGDPYNDIYTGWTYAPKDYRKWEALCFEVTRHLVEKYGRREVESWWFELWNEPDIGYWSGSVGPARPRRSAGGTEGADAPRRVQQALRLHRRGRAPGAADRADRRSRGHRRCAGHAPLVPAAHLVGHQLRHRQDRHAARRHHLPRQGQPDVRRQPRAHGRRQPASQHRQALRGRPRVPDVRQDAAS